MDSQNKINQNTTAPNILVVVDSSFTSDKAIAEDVCTYKYTKTRYSLQKWYLCLSCNIYCCLVCKNKCHNNHILDEEKESDFFCDCAVENKDCIGLK